MKSLQESKEQVFINIIKLSVALHKTNKLIWLGTIAKSVEQIKVHGLESQSGLHGIRLYSETELSWSEYAANMDLSSSTLSSIIPTATRFQCHIPEQSLILFMSLQVR